MGRLFLVVVAFSTGCATSLSTFQPAHVAPKGTVQASVGQDLSIPTGSITKAVDAGKTAAKAANERMLTDEERFQLIAAGLHVALDPPALVTHAAVNYVPIDRVDVGVRYSSGAWRLGGRYQLAFQERSGYDLTIGVGVQRFTYKLPLQDFLDYVNIEKFTRYNFDIPVIFGAHSDYHRFWGGPKFLVSTFDAGLHEALPAVGGQTPPPHFASASGTCFYVGAQGGVAVGYRAIFVGAELTVARLFGEAKIDSSAVRRSVDIGGWVVYPGIALMGEF